MNKPKNIKTKELGINKPETYKGYEIDTTYGGVEILKIMKNIKAIMLYVSEDFYKKHIENKDIKIEDHKVLGFVNHYFYISFEDFDKHIDPLISKYNKNKPKNIKIGTSKEWEDFVKNAEINLTNPSKRIMKLDLTNEPGYVLSNEKVIDFIKRTIDFETLCRKSFTKRTIKTTSKSIEIVWTKKEEKE